MQLIDAAQATGVTINAVVDGGGGDWAPAEEVYPIDLGWGVELNAPGVYFFDPNGAGNDEIIDVTFYSLRDLTGYASIVGGVNPVAIGMNAAETQQTDDLSAITIEKGATLYIANAYVNDSVVNPFVMDAIKVNGGAT